MFCYNNFFVVIVIQLFFYLKTQKLPNSSIKPQFKKKSTSIIISTQNPKKQIPFFSMMKKKDGLCVACKKKNTVQSEFLCLWF